MHQNITPRKRTEEKEIEVYDRQSTRVIDSLLIFVYQNNYVSLTDTWRGTEEIKMKPRSSRTCI